MNARKFREMTDRGETELSNCQECGKFSQRCNDCYLCKFCHSYSACNGEWTKVKNQLKYSIFVGGEIGTVEHSDTAKYKSYPYRSETPTGTEFHRTIIAAKALVEKQLREGSG